MRAGCYLAVVAAALVCVATSDARSTVPKLLFPVVGSVDYHDDFGEPRGNLPHRGNDLVAAKRAPAVAVEGGTVEYWTTSASAGCMLYLYGDSGTMYEYIHLNNDLTARNDNKGKCVKGVAYAVPDKARVVAGQQIGYVGDSGDANGIHAHLHFEVHPKGGKAVDPYPFLRKAARLLAPAPADGALFTLRLTGTLVEASGTQLTLSVDTVTAWPSHVKQTKVDRIVSLATTGDLLASAVPGTTIVAWTMPAAATVSALTGAPAALTVDRVETG
jgi:peptidase M23-like protein